MKFISDRRQFSFRRVFIATIILGAALALLVTSYYLYSVGMFNNNSQQIDSKIQAEVNEFYLAEEAKPFVYQLVPDVTSITLPPPLETSLEDKATYEALKALAIKKTLQDVVDDTVYNVSFHGTTYDEFINNSKYQRTLYQMHDEVRQLVAQFNQQYNRLPLAQRIEGVTQIGEIEKAIFNQPDTAAVYPNVRSAEAFLVADILSKIDPQSSAVYLEQAEGLAKRGIAYGHYGQSDLEASRSLVNQYLLLFYKNNPDVLKSITSQNPGN